MPCTLILHPHLFFTLMSMPLRIPISCMFLSSSSGLWSQILFWWTWVVNFGVKQREHWSFNGMCAVIMCLLTEYCILGLVFLSNLMLVGGIQNQKMRAQATKSLDLCEKTNYIMWVEDVQTPQRSGKKKDRRQESTVAWHEEAATNCI